MKTRFYQSTELILPVILTFTFSCSKQVNMKPPVADKIPEELTIHNHTRIDNYYWMNERENPEVIAFLEAENAYKDAVMKPTEDLQDRLFEEIKSKIKPEDESVPYKKNGTVVIDRYWSCIILERNLGSFCGVFF